MAWSEEGFRFAVVRLPLPGAGLDEFDRYAIGSGVPIGDPDFRTYNYGDRLVLASNSLVTTGGTWSYRDRLSIGRAAGDLDPSSGTVVVEIFDTEYTLDPTWDVIELPQLNDGSLVAGINSFSVSFEGQTLFTFDPNRTITVARQDRGIDVKFESRTITSEVRKSFKITVIT